MTLNSTIQLYPRQSPGMMQMLFFHYGFSRRDRREEAAVWMKYKIKNLLLETRDNRVHHLFRAIYLTITDSCCPQNDLFIPPPPPPPFPPPPLLFNILVEKEWENRNIRNKSGKKEKKKPFPAFPPCLWSYV